MRIVVDTEEMLKMLSRLSNALDEKSSLDTFRIIRVDVVGGKLRFTGSTPSITASDIYDRDEKKRSVIEPFGINGKELYESVRVLGKASGHCTIVIDKNQMVIEHGTTKLKFRKYSEDNLIPLDDGWPHREGEMRKLNPEDFCKALKKILFVPDNDQERDLQSSTIHINNDHIVTTNRKIMAILENQWISGLNVPFNVTGNTASKLIKILSSLEGDCDYIIENGCLYLYNKCFRAKLIGAVLAYPSYKTILLGIENNISFEINKSDMMVALRTADIAMFRHKDLKSVTLNFTKSGIIVSSSAQSAESSAIVPYPDQYEKSYLQMIEKELGEIPFDLSLLSQGIASFSSERIMVTVDNPMRPFKLSEGGLEHGTGGYDLVISRLRFA